MKDPNENRPGYKKTEAVWISEWQDTKHVKDRNLISIEMDSFLKIRDWQVLTDVMMNGRR